MIAAAHLITLISWYERGFITYSQFVTALLLSRKRGQRS